MSWSSRTEKQNPANFERGEKENKYNKWTGNVFCCCWWYSKAKLHGKYPNLYYCHLNISRKIAATNGLCVVHYNTAFDAVCFMSQSIYQISHTHTNSICGVLAFKHFGAMPTWSLRQKNNSNKKTMLKIKHVEFLSKSEI